jgi:hypothetical protein
MNASIDISTDVIANIIVDVIADIIADNGFAAILTYSGRGITGFVTA